MKMTALDARGNMGAQPFKFFISLAGMLEGMPTRIAVVFGIASFAWMSYLYGFRLNLTASVPVGVYLRDANGGLVEFCPAEPFASLSRARGYRAGGICADGGQPLLKRVVARAGDRVEMSGAGVRINTWLHPASAPRALDAKGLPMPVYPSGIYTLAAGELWVMGDHPRSFDSRYFGPIAESAVRARMRLLW